MHIKGNEVETMKSALHLEEYFKTNKYKVEMDMPKANTSNFLKIFQYQLVNVDVGYGGVNQIFDLHLQEKM